MMVNSYKQKFTREFLMNCICECFASSKIWFRCFTPDKISIRCICKTTCNRLINSSFCSVETFWCTFTCNKCLITGSISLVIKSAASASVRAIISVGAPIRQLLIEQKSNYESLFESVRKLYHLNDHIFSQKTSWSSK